jgi:hypothetical protein
MKHNNYFIVFLKNIFNKYHVLKIQISTIYYFKKKLSYVILIKILDDHVMFFKKS